MIGLEADAAYTYLGKTRFTDYTNSNSPFGGDVNEPAAARLTSSLAFLGTVRGRVGYAFDRLLVFGTGGLAYGDVAIGWPPSTTTFPSPTSWARPPA